MNVFTWLRNVLKTKEEDIARVEPKLVKSVAVLVLARCPCGSQIDHALSLYSSRECPRCGRTIGIRSIHFDRAGIEHLPEAHVSIGFVVTKDTLRRAKTGGVH